MIWHSFPLESRGRPTEGSEVKVRARGFIQNTEIFRTPAFQAALWSPRCRRLRLSLTFLGSLACFLAVL